MGAWGRQLIRVVDGLAELVLCCNRGDVAARDWLRREYPAVRAGSSAREAIDDPTVDAIVIATPITTHAALATAGLEAGKHVFVEKPLATTSAEARRVVDVARQADRQLFVGHTFLFDAGLEALQAIVCDDPIERIELTWLKYGTFGEPLVWNLLPHEVSIAMWLVGVAPALTILEHAPGETALDRLRLGLAFRNAGRTGCIEIDRMHHETTKTVRAVTRSGADYLWREGNLFRLRKGSEPDLLSARSEETLVREVRAFFESIRTGQAPRTDGPFGASVVDVIAPVAAALEAAVAGQPGGSR
jgi:predicted dehydrogenase